VTFNAPVPIHPERLAFFPPLLEGHGAFVCDQDLALTVLIRALQATCQCKDPTWRSSSGLWRPGTLEPAASEHHPHPASAECQLVLAVACLVQWQQDSKRRPGVASPVPRLLVLRPAPMLALPLPGSARGRGIGDSDDGIEKKAGRSCTGRRHSARVPILLITIRPAIIQLCIYAVIHSSLGSEATTVMLLPLVMFITQRMLWICCKDRYTWRLELPNVPKVPLD
jgi:hypothetical protein